MNDAVRMAYCDMICMPIFMEIGIGVQALVRFSFRKRRGCDVAITCGGFTNCAFEMGSGVMIYIPDFIKIGSRIQKIIGQIRIRKHTQTKMKVIL
jgi:hypothetical protein